MFSCFPLPGMQLLFAWALASLFASVRTHSFSFAEQDIKQERSSDLRGWTQALLPQTRGVRRVLQIYSQHLFPPQPLPCNSKPLLSWTLPGSYFKGASLFPRCLTNSLCTPYGLSQYFLNVYGWDSTEYFRAALYRAVSAPWTVSKVSQLVHSTSQCLFGKLTVHMISADALTLIFSLCLLLCSHLTSELMGECCIYCSVTQHMWLRFCYHLSCQHSNKLNPNFHVMVQVTQQSQLFWYICDCL